MENNLIDSGQYDFKDIPGSESWVRLSEITIGDSNDRKFRIRDNEDRSYFLRIADPRLYDRKKNEFEHMKAAYAMGAAVPNPVEFGLCCRGKALFLMSGWIHGKSGAVQLSVQEPYKQYDLGTAAGLYLKMIHRCQIPPRQPASWEAAQSKRWRAAFDRYRCCRRKIPYEHKLLGMIENSLPLLANRPQCLLHGGFDTDNIVLSYEGSLSLIDFDKWLYGDPLLDLGNVLTGIRRACLPYAIGIFDCYFAFGISDLDLQLMSLYAAMALVEQFAAAEAVGEDNVHRAMETAQTFIRDLQGCKSFCPSWYKRFRTPPDAAGKGCLADASETT